MCGRNPSISVSTLIDEILHYLLTPYLYRAMKLELNERLKAFKWGHGPLNTVQTKKVWEERHMEWWEHGLWHEL